MASPAWALAMAAVLLLAVPTVVWRFAAARGPRSEVTAWVSSGLVRDAGGELTRVRIPRGCQLVRLELDPVPAKHDRYRAALHEATGHELWSLLPGLAPVGIPLNGG